ncbi:MAG: TonB-dependent receptor [Bdellovibrio sp.]|nr:TonB-dependent receptor [Bdellovibrio sp.]
MRVFIAILLGMQACFAQAQTTETYQLQQVQIRGNKEEKTYLESTESITVLESEGFDKAVKTDSIKDLNALPNVQVNTNDNNFSIRGINNLGVTGYQQDNLASILVDDVFQTDLAISAGAFDFWDLDHVEIYRGAQSTTQGVNSLAGNILLFHRKATGQNEGAAKIGLGNYGQKEVGLVTNNVFLDGKVLTRVAVNVERNDGFIKNLATDNDRWGHKDKNYITGDFIYKLSETDEIRWNVKIMQTDNGGNYTQGTNAFDYEVNEDVDARYLTNNQQTSLRYVTKINESYSNEVIAAFSQSQQDGTSDADGTATNVAGTRYETHSDQYASVENLLKYQSDKIKNVLGLHIHDMQLRDKWDFKVITGGPIIPVMQKNEKLQQTYAVFDSLLYKFDEKHALNMGLRYEYTANDYETVIETTLPGYSGTFNGDENNGVLLPKLGYIYTLDNHSYGISYTQGYRTGGVSINRNRHVANQYDPEKTDNFEGSYKFAQDKVKISANVFYTMWHDQQVLVALSNTMYDTQVMNAASSELYGGEFEGKYEITPKNLIAGGVGYTNTKFLDFESKGVDYSGNQFPFASNWTGTVTYTFRPSDAWSWDTALRYLSSSYTNAENSRTSPEQWLIDTGVVYLLAKYNLTTEVYVRNVFDQHYVINDVSSDVYNVKYYQTNTPREFGARLTYFW